MAVSCGCKSSGFMNVMAVKGNHRWHGSRVNIDSCRCRCCRALGTGQAMTKYRQLDTDNCQKLKLDDNRATL